MGCRVKSSDLLIGAGGPAMVLHCSDACHSAKVSDDRPRWLAIDGLRLMVCGPSTLADGARPGAWTHGSYLCGPHAWETLGGARRSVAKAISSLTNAGDAYAYTHTRRRWRLGSASVHHVSALAHMPAVRMHCTHICATRARLPAGWGTGLRWKSWMECNQHERKTQLNVVGLHE